MPCGQTLCISPHSYDLQSCACHCEPEANVPFITMVDVAAWMGAANSPSLLQVLDGDEPYQEVTIPDAPDSRIALAERQGIRLAAKSVVLCALKGALLRCTVNIPVPQIGCVCPCKACWDSFVEVFVEVVKHWQWNTERTRSLDSWSLLASHAARRRQQNLSPIAASILQRTVKIRVQASSNH